MMLKFQFIIQKPLRHSQKFSRIFNESELENNFYKDKLFCQRLFKDQNENVSLKDLLLLPLLKKRKKQLKQVDNFTFEPAEKTLQKAFYQDSYKQCCKIDVESTKNTKLLKENYDNLWNNVKSIVKSKSFYSGNKTQRYTHNKLEKGIYSDFLANNNNILSAKDEIINRLISSVLSVFIIVSLNCCV